MQWGILTQFVSFSLRTSIIFITQRIIPFTNFSSRKRRYSCSRWWGMFQDKSASQNASLALPEEQTQDSMHSILRCVYSTLLPSPGFFPRTSAYSSKLDGLRWRRSAFPLHNKDNMGSLLIEKKKNKETCVKILFVLLMYLFPCLFVSLMGCRKLHTGHFRHLIIAKTRNYKDTSSLHYYYFIIYLFRREISKFLELFLNCSSSHLSPDSMENIQVYTTFHYKHI